MYNIVLKDFFFFFERWGVIKGKYDRSNITKLTICAHNLEIEKGCYFQINKKNVELKDFVKYAMI